MTRLALSTVRSRKVGFAGSLAAVTLAVALISAVLTLLLSGRQAVPEADRFGGAAAVLRADPDLHVRAGENDTALPLDRPARLPAGLVERLRAVPGVRSVATDTPFYAQVAGDGGALAGPAGGPSNGHPWQAAALTPFTLRAGHPPAAADEVVVDADLARRGGLRPGSPVRIVTEAGVAGYRVSGVAATRDGAGLPSQAAIFFADRTARRLAGKPMFAGLIGEPRGPLPAAQGVQVLAGDRAARAGSPEVSGPLADTTLLFGPMGGIAAFLAIFVIAGTLGLSILQRGREIALLRAIGATPGQIRRMVTAEALLVALAAAVPGCVLSVPLAHAIRAMLVDRGVAPPAFTIVTGPAFAPAVLAGLVLCLVAALGAVRHAARVRPADALREVAGRRRAMTVPRLAAAVLSLGGAVGVFLLSQRLGGEVGVAFQGVEVLLLMAAAALLAPPLTRLLEPLAGGLVAALGRTTGWLAHANSAAAPRRVASAAAGLALCVGMAGYALLVTGALASATADQGARRVSADRVLVGKDAPGLPAEVAAAARRLPSAAAVSPVVSTTFVTRVLGTPDVVPARGVDPATAGQVLDLRVREGSLAGLARPGTVAVSRSHAGEHGWHAGDRISGRLGDGTPATLTVAAVFDRSLGFGDFVFAADALAGHAGTRLHESVLIRARPGAAAALDRELAALARRLPTVEVSTGADHARDARTGLERNATGTYLALGVLVAFAAVSVANTFVMGTAERAREFTLLRLVGAGRGQIVAMIGLEAAITLLIGAVVGTAICLIVLAGATGALTGSPGLALPGTRYALILAGAAALALGASAPPTVMAVRNRPGIPADR